MIITAVRKKFLFDLIHFGDLPIDRCAGQNKPYKTPLLYSQIHCIAPAHLQTSDGFFCFIKHLSGGGVNANRNATCLPSLACKNKTEKDCNCSRIAKETAMMKSSLQMKSQHSFLEVTFYIHME